MFRVPERGQGGFIQDMTTLRTFGPIMKPCLWTAWGLNCSDHAQVLTKLEYMKPLLMATRNCTRDSLHKIFISNIVCVVIVERATGCEVFCSQDVINTLSFFQGSSLREATNLEQSHSRVVAQEKGVSSKHGEEERVKPSSKVVAVLRLGISLVTFWEKDGYVARCL